MIACLPVGMSWPCTRSGTAWSWQCRPLRGRWRWWRRGSRSWRSPGRGKKARKKRTSIDEFCYIYTSSTASLIHVCGFLKKAATIFHFYAMSERADESFVFSTLRKGRLERLRMRNNLFTHTCPPRAGGRGGVQFFRWGWCGVVGLGYKRQRKIGRLRQPKIARFCRGGGRGLVGQYYINFLPGGMVFRLG